MIHGIGAETGTQVLIISAIGGAAGVGLGIPMMIAFIIGLLISNTAIVVLTATGFIASQLRQRIYLVIGVLAGVFSLVVGVLFLFEAEATLPDLGSIFGFIGARLLTHAAPSPKPPPRLHIRSTSPREHRAHRHQMGSNKEMQMNGSRRGGLFGVLVVIVIALIVGGLAYTAGLSAGQTAVVAPGAVPGTVVYPVGYGPGWHGFGFGFGIFGFLFLFLLIGLLFRAFGGWGGRRGGWGGPGWDRVALVVGRRSAAHERHARVLASAGARRRAPPPPSDRPTS